MHKLEVVNLSKHFKDKKVINKMSVQFESGKIYGIMGPNGSGKTVLLKLLSGLMTPTSGDIKYDGKIITPGDISKINFGVSIEKPQFIEELTGFENLMFLRDFRKITNKDEILEWLSYFDLIDDKDNTVKSYSLGMKQKLSIIQALMEDPNIILLDEVSNSLDKSSREELYKLLAKFKARDKIIIYINHNADEMRYLCDVIYEFDQRKLVLCEV